MPILSSWEGDSHQILPIVPLKYHPNISTWYIYIHMCIYIYIILPPTFQIIAPFNWLKSPISHIVFLFFIIFDPRSTRSTLKSRLYQLHVANLKQKHWKPRVVVRWYSNEFPDFEQKHLHFFFRFLTFLYCSKCLKRVAITQVHPTWSNLYVLCRKCWT